MLTVQFGTIFKALSAIWFISALITAAFAQQVAGTDQGTAIRQDSALESGGSVASRALRTPLSGEDAFRTVAKPDFTMSAEEAYRTVGGDVSRPSIGPKTAAALAAVAALTPAPPNANSSTSLYRAGNEQAAQAEKARVYAMDNQGVPDILASLPGRSVTFFPSLLWFGLPFIFIAVYLAYRRVAIHHQTRIDGKAKPSESFFASNVIASNVLSPDEVCYVQSYANELGKLVGMQGFAKFTELNLSIMSIAVGLMHRDVPIMLGTIVVVKDETGNSCSVRDLSNRPMPGPDFYPTIDSALRSTHPFFENMAHATVKHLRPNFWRRLFG